MTTPLSPSTQADILVVEDTPASLELLAELLTQAGYSVRCAQDGRLALRSAQAAPPDLILLDVRMPGMDGHEVCRHLKADERTRDVPVIFLSALRDVDTKVRAFEFGAVDYIAKPYQPDEVLARVHTHVELRRLQSRLEERVAERTAQLQASEANLRTSQAQLQELAGFLQTVREEERARIARELHDELGQALTALRIDLGWLRGQCTPLGPDTLARADASYGLVLRTIDALRRISEGLRPGMLDTLGLAAALEHHVEQFKERTGTAVELTMNREEFDLDEKLATAIFRVVQEAMTNIARHALATQVTILLHEREDDIELSIEDDGRGFTPNPAHKSFGLLGMRERIKALGGHIAIDSRPGGGTRITAQLPKLEREAP